MKLKVSQPGVFALLDGKETEVPVGSMVPANLHKGDVIPGWLLGKVIDVDNLTPVLNEEPLPAPVVTVEVPPSAKPVAPPEVPADEKPLAPPEDLAPPAAAKATIPPVK